MSAIIHIEGHAGRDSESSALPTGTDVCKVSVAVTIYKGRDKEKVTNWYNVAMFGNSAKAIADVRKGDSLMVCGTLEIREYTDKSGEKRTSNDINGQYVSNLSKFVRSRSDDDGGGSSYAPRQQRKPEPAFDDIAPF